MNYIPGLECIDENDAGINYEGDEIDKNDNKSSLHEYHLSQYITSQTSNTSLTQFSETSLSNVRTNLDFDSISIMSQKRKRTLNDNFLTKKHLKKNTLSKVDSKAMSISHGALCGSQQIAKINIFKLSSQTLYSSSSDSSSSESNSERLFQNIKIKNAFTLTP